MTATNLQGDSIMEEGVIAAVVREDLRLGEGATSHQKGWYQMSAKNSQAMAVVLSEVCTAFHRRGE